MKSEHPPKLDYQTPGQEMNVEKFGRATILWTLFFIAVGAFLAVCFIEWIRPRPVP